MTVKEVADYVDKVKENSFDFDTKLLWINDVESKLMTFVFGRSPDEFKPHTLGSDELTAPFAFSDIYTYYMIAMIDLLCGELEKYSVSSAAYNSSLKDYAKWVIRGKK